METFIFDWWWRSRLPLAREGLCILWCVLERWIRNQHQILVGKKNWVGSRVHHNTELWTQLMVSLLNSRAICSQDSPHSSAAANSKSSFLKMSEEPEDFTGRIIFMSMFNDISWGSEDNERECNASADLVSFFARRFPAGRWSFLGPGSEKKWYSSFVDRPQGEWGRVAVLMMLLQFGERRHPVFRSRLVSLLKFVIDLVLDETSLVDKILLVCHNSCVCFTFALRTYQVDLVNNRSWFFQTPPSRCIGL